MKTETIVPTETFEVSARDAETKVRELMGEADVKRVTVRDRHGHTLVEIPVRPDQMTTAFDAVASATKALADRVGDLELQVEKEPGLPAEGGSRASMRERERARASGQATGSEVEGGATREDVAKAPANVTERDAERIREANAVPTGDARRDRDLEPEQLGNPDLKDTSTPYSPSQAGRKDRRRSR